MMLYRNKIDDKVIIYEPLLYQVSGILLGYGF